MVEVIGTEYGQPRERWGRDMVEVIDTQGACKECGRDELLGNGICEKCWDKMSGSFYSGNGRKKNYSKEVVNFALSLVETKVSYVKVKAAIEEKFGVSPSTEAIHAWKCTAIILGEVA